MSVPAFYREVVEPAPTAETSVEDAKGAISRMVYKVAMYMEKLEDAGKIEGNAHHVAQKLADTAAKEVEEHWIDKEIALNNSN